MKTTYTNIVLTIIAASLLYQVGFSVWRDYNPNPKSIDVFITNAELPVSLNADMVMDIMTRKPALPVTIEGFSGHAFGYLQGQTTGLPVLIGK